jgi:hypothetical protein
MTTITFSSASLPEHLDDHRRFDLWRDIYTAQFGLLDFAISEQLAFSATMEITPLGAVALGRMRGTIERVSRTARDVAVDGRDDYCLVVNQGATMSGRLGRKNFELPGGGAVLMSNADSGSIARPATGGGDDWLNVIVPGTLLRQTMGNADDLVACATPGGSEALTLLAGYAALLQRQGTIASERLAHFATDTLLGSTQCSGRSSSATPTSAFRPATSPPRFASRPAMSTTSCRKAAPASASASPNCVCNAPARCWPTAAMTACASATSPMPQALPTFPTSIAASAGASA